MTVTAISMVGLMLAGSAWLQRTESGLVALDPTGPYRLATAAGPVTVSNAEPAALHYRSSWLLRGPDRRIGDEGAPPPSDVGLACTTRFPCRVGSEIQVPAEADLVVEAADDDVLVSRFSGDLTVRSTGVGDVILGPVAGRLTISSERGAVVGRGLTASVVDIDTTGGEIDLSFAARPERLVIKSGSRPVTVRLPDGDYAVSVKGGSSIAVTVGQEATADGEITIQARGPVRIEPTE